MRGGVCDLIRAMRNGCCSNRYCPKSRKSARVDDRKIVNAVLCAAHWSALARFAGALRALHDGL